MVDHYAVLGVDPDADRATIERAYRRRVKAVHPDRNDAPDADEQFRRVQEAREVLTDPEARARYDRRRERRTGREQADADGADRTAASADGGVSEEWWADVRPEGWVQAERERQHQREQRARQRRRRRHEARAGSEWEVGGAPEWYTASADEVSDVATGNYPRRDAALVALTVLYGLAFTAVVDALPLSARLVVALLAVMSVVFVLRLPEVAVPVVGVGATVVLPVLALLGLPLLSPAVFVGVLAIAVPGALAALFVRLR